MQAILEAEEVSFTLMVVGGMLKEAARFLWRVQLQDELQPYNDQHITTRNSISGKKLNEEHAYGPLELRNRRL